MDLSIENLVYKLVYDVLGTLGYKQSLVPSLFLISKLNYMFDIPQHRLANRPKLIDQEPAGR